MLTATESMPPSVQVPKLGSIGASTGSEALEDAEKKPTAASPTATPGSS